MFFGYDLKEIFTFPFKDADARKHLLVGCLISAAALFIPILPYLVLIGYSAIIARQVLKGEEPHMVAWDDWGTMFKDGAKLLGIRLIFSLPILILVMPLIAGGVAMPFLAEGMNSESLDIFLAVFTAIMIGSMCLLIPISLPLAVLIPAAEMHMIEKDDFAAGFRFKEWWPILRANLGGFILAFGIYYAASMILAFLIQILAATIIFACLLIILLPATTMYISLIMYTTTSIAYKDGKAKLPQIEAESQPA